MKKHTFLALSLIFLLSACGNRVDESSPESVTVAAWKAINEVDFDEIRQYATEGSQGGVDLAEAASKQFPLLSKVGRMVKRTGVSESMLKVENVVCEQEGETATCYFKYNSGEINYDVPTKLEKENGKWRFIFIRQ